MRGMNAPWSKPRVLSNVQSEKPAECKREAMFSANWGLPGGLYLRE